MAYTPPSGDAANFYARAYGQNFVARKTFWMSGASYTIPNWDAVDFVMAGYEYPLGDAANFGASPQAPTVTFAGSSTTDFRMVVEEARVFSSAGSTTTGMEHPYREMQIFSSSDLQAYTWLRSPEITSQTTPVFRPGARIEFVGGTTLDVPAIATVRAVSAFSSGSTNYFVGTGIHYVQFSVLNKTLTKLKGGRIQPLDFVVQTKTTLTPRAITTAKVAFSGVCGSSQSWHSATYKPTTGVISSSSSQSFYGRGYANATYASIGASETIFAGQEGALAAWNIPALSTTAFVSSMSVNYVPPEPDVCVFVTTRQKSVFVRAA